MVPFGKLRVNSAHHERLFYSNFSTQTFALSPVLSWSKRCRRANREFFNSLLTPGKGNYPGFVFFAAGVICVSNPTVYHYDALAVNFTVATKPPVQ